MEKQVRFSDIEYDTRRKKTKKELFLEQMSKSVPLELICSVVKPYYYLKGNGREPINLETMVKMYLVSHWYNTSDEGTEDLIYESNSVKRYIGVIDSNVPDATTLQKFRVEIIERNNLGNKIFAELTKVLTEKKILLKEGTIVDATIISAPDSTKNKEKKPNPNMSATKKGSKYYFGLKAHIGVDMESGLVHSAVATKSNLSDVEIASKVLHGEEKIVSGDAGYIGIDKREEVCEIYQDGSGRKEKQKYSNGKKRADTLVKRADIEFRINRKRCQAVTEEEKDEEREKSRVRSKVEHVFCILKHIFKYRLARYRTIEKNEEKLLMLFALANIYRCAQRNISIR